MRSPSTCRRSGARSSLADVAVANASPLGIPVRGTLALVLIAKRLGRIASARDVLDELRRAGMYLSDRVVHDALRLVGE